MNVPAVSIPKSRLARKKTNKTRLEKERCCFIPEKPKKESLPKVDKVPQRKRKFHVEPRLLLKGEVTF